MNQPAGDKSVPLPVYTYGRRVKNQIVNDFMTAESPDGNGNCNNNND
jgi:hypothetical protein